MLAKNRLAWGAMWLLLVVGLAACDPAPPPVVIPPGQPATIAAPEPTVPVATETTAAPADPTPEPTAVPDPTAEPTAPPPAGAPGFSNLRFSESPGLSNTTNVFIEPNEVFAIWQYSNMRDGDRVRRDWYINDALFISREELWDTAVYGPNGMRTDVSLYDYEDGLEPGSYRVVLAINDQTQIEQTFSVEEDETPPAEPQTEADITGISFAWSPDEDRRFGYFENASEVFAIIDYENMSSSDVIKRDWYYNGRLFISREEPWDVNAYGTSGTRSDISIFDYEDGLGFGNYRLVLSINDEKKMEQRFEVGDEGVGYVPKKINIYGFSQTQSTSPGGNEFEGANEVFAVMNYEDMQPGDVVKREWYFNEEPFITREEEWDFNEYGASGLRNDISIFDFEDGLEFGEYRLLIEVNGQYQGDTIFKVIPLQLIAPLKEPVSGRTAETIAQDTILITYPDGSTETFDTAYRVVHIDWFPGGDKLVYTNQLVIDPDVYPIFGLAHQVVVIDLANNASFLLTSEEENLHHPLVSPSGNAIALLQGNGYGDACYVGLSLVIIQVNDMGFEIGRVDPLDFPLIQADEDEGFSTRTINFNDSYASRSAGLYSMEQVNPGEWVDSDTLKTEVGWNSCVPPGGGIYQLDVDTLEAELVEEYDFGE